MRWVLLCLFLLGAILRLYNLNWGAPFYFHPDERNIASLITTYSIADPATFLKGTFAYGTFLSLTAFILMILTKPLFLFGHVVDPFTQATLILRMQSVVFALLTLVFLLRCQPFWKNRAAMLAFIFGVFSIGFIQQSHFGTFDGFVACCSLAVFVWTVLLLQTKKLKYFYLSLAFVALGAATKVTILVLAIFPFIVLLTIIRNQKPYLLTLLKHLLLGGIILASPLLLSPYYTTEEFQGGLTYERGVVTGTTPVFYTQSFTNTTPVLFQFLHIYPFLINPVLTVLFLIAFPLVFYQGIKKRQYPTILACLFFLVLFIPQAFLFTKWTRYMIPTLPFMYLIISIGLSTLWEFTQRKKQQWIGAGVISITVLASVLWGISYVVTAFVQQDTRVQASTFAAQTIPASAQILSEPYDLGIMPFQKAPNVITIFNAYDMEQTGLEPTLTDKEFIILPSQRILKTRLLQQDAFPKGHALYQALDNGSLGYKKVYETPCDIFCTITYLGDPIFQFDETASVFERPTVFIYQKQ